MIVLGLNHGELNSSAALSINGKIIAGAPEERFNRQKKSKTFPRQSIEFCLRAAGIKLQECDYVAQAWNPGASWHKYNPMLSGQRIRREDNLYSIPDNLFNLVDRKPIDWLLMSFPEHANIPPIYHIQHHRAHAANAFFLSPFEDAAILTCDWRGEYESTTLAIGKGKTIEVLTQQTIPHSLGMFYATYTELLGYKPDDEEWKVMALSAFDVECRQHVEKIRGTVTLLDNGIFELDQSYYKGALVDEPRLYTGKLVKLLGGREGVPGAEPDEWHMSIARAMQIVSEDIATHILNHLYGRTGCKSVVLGGGFFMNAVFNGKIIERSPFEGVYISYSPADVGNSIGAALYVAHCLHSEDRDLGFHASYMGPSFTDCEIEKVLLRRRIRYELIKNIPIEIAGLLAKGEIVALLTGRMEFGERALGNRSILADPRRQDIKRRINCMIKYRESYRPFAPAVVQEKVQMYFDVPMGFESPYMEKVVAVRKAYREYLPAITHVDGSGRVQTVRRNENEIFYDIIAEFGKVSGFPIVLNTSFNINGEPIVLSPDDALNTFYNSGLEYLVMGKYLIRKNG